MKVPTVIIFVTHFKVSVVSVLRTATSSFVEVKAGLALNNNAAAMRRCCLDNRRIFTRFPHAPQNAA